MRHNEHNFWFNKILFTPINKKPGLAFATNTGCSHLHRLGDLGFLCSLGSSLQKKKKYTYVTTSDKINPKTVTGVNINVHKELTP